MESSDSVNETFDKQEEIFAWNIDEAFESDQATIGFFYLCAYQNDSEKTARYDQTDVRALNEELLSAFSSWVIEEDWEVNKFYTFQCADRKVPGCEKVLNIYNGYDRRLLHCRLTNMDESEKETVVSLLKKYYNHISFEFDANKALKEASVPDPDMDFSFLDDLLNGIVTREYLEDNWDVSSYNEGEECQIDYYIRKDDNAAGDTAYAYYHEDDELRKLEIVHIIARSSDEAAYDALLEDDDVLLNGEEEYGADCSAEFIMWYDSYLVWFKEAEQE